MDGAAAVGVTTKYAREDHVHPSDTTKYNASNPSGYQTAAQVSTSLQPYAPLASPIFTGDPKAPTPTAGDNDTSIATTAFVTAAGAAITTAYQAADTTLTTSVNGKVAKAGDTMTGPLTVNYASPSISIAKTAAAQETLLLGFNGANKRWALSLGDTAAELGSDAGSNFAIYRYNDAGSIRDAPLTINRAAATAVFANNVTLSAGYFAAPGGFAVSGAGGGCTLSGDATNSYWFVNQPNNCYIQYAKASGQLTFIVNSAAVFYWDVNKNFITTAGGYKPGGGTWADSSDARIKNVEGDFTTGLDAVAALRPVTFTFKGNDTPDAPAHFTTSFDTETKDAPTVPYPNSPHRQAAVDGKRFHGLIAQDVESVFPEMVTQRAGYIDGVAVNDIRDLDTGPLIFALVNSVKELKTHIDTLNTRLATLEAA